MFPLIGFLNRGSCALAWIVVGWVLTEGVTGLSAQEVSEETIRTLRALNRRSEIQKQSVLKFQSFSQFQFTDRVIESQIRFVHRIVEDIGKEYKAAHYDHGNGVAVADIDGDGWFDLYFTTQLQTNQLWRNQGDGTFENITDRAAVGLPHQISVGASFADIDNDGDPDLFVTTVRKGNHLFENLGEGNFRDITVDAGVGYSGHSSGAVFLDYDRDGRLDLFLVNVGQYTTQTMGVGGYYMAYEDAFSGHLFPERSEASILYRNLGENRFEDVSHQMDLVDTSWSGDATFTDLNQDQYPDLYLPNMQGDDHYYENQGGKKFLDRTDDYFPKTSWGAMGVKFFDFNQDGRLDLFVTDMHSDMSRPQTELAYDFELTAEKSKSEAFCSVQWTEDYLQDSSNNLFGNAFYRNQGELPFKEISTELGVETYWPWGVSVGDFNADGYEDLFITAGMGYPFRYGINTLLLNEKGERFFDAEFVLGVEPRGNGRVEKPWFQVDCDGADREHSECQGRSGERIVSGTLSSRSSVIFDLDQDGDLDLVTNDLNYRAQILISNLSEQHPVNYLKIQLRGTRSNRDGLGSWVKVYVSDRVLTQYYDGKSGYLSQSSMPLYFGLGDAGKVDAIEVLWPSRVLQRFENLDINQLVVIQESELRP